MLIDEIMTKLNRILEGLMSCRLEFQPVSQLSPDEWNTRDLALMCVNEESAPSYVEGESTGAFGFPVNLHGTFAGLAVVRGMRGARSAQLIQLAELLTAVLESSVTRQDRGDRLRMMEEQIQLLREEMKEDSNVVKLRSSRPTQEFSVTDMPEPYEPIESPITTTPLLIQVTPGFPLQRIALEIHHMAGRWAFLAIENLASDVLDSREGLKELGGITLYIEDICKLSEHQQVKLAEYLATQPSQDMPQIIAGTIESARMLRENGKISARLLDLLCVSELTWNNKTGAEVTRELIEASLRFIVEKTRESVVHGEPGRYLPFHMRELSDSNGDSSTLH